MEDGKEAMKVREIPVSDIQGGKIWKVVDTGYDNDWLDWELMETRKVTARDVIAHSAVIVEAHRTVHPYLQTRYYEDGGEVGESAVFLDGRWTDMGPEVDLEAPLEGPFLAHVSTLDIHEYQKGSFDNRPEHYAKFWHYAPQINSSSSLIPFPVRPIPNKYLRMSAAELVEYVRTIPPQIEKLHAEGKVQKGNRLAERLYQLVPLLKKNPENHSLLRSLLVDDDPAVVSWLQFMLVDIFEAECVELIRRMAKEDRGFGARCWLKQHGYGQED